MDKTTVTQHIARLIKVTVVASLLQDVRELRRTRLALIWWTKQVTSGRAAIDQETLAQCRHMLKQISFSFMYSYTTDCTTLQTLLIVRQLLQEMTHNGNT